jgi:hypothetical protein
LVFFLYYYFPASFFCALHSLHPFAIYGLLLL